MTGRARQFTVVLLMVSFALIAAHSYLLNERPSEQRDCPLCHWFQNLTHGEMPDLAVEGVEIARSASAEVPLVFCAKHHRAPFSARSPPFV